MNEKPNISAEYRRELRKALYYCKKFGIDEHLMKTGNSTPKELYIKKLLGRVNYVLSVRSGDKEFLRYRDWLLTLVS